MTGPGDIDHVEVIFLNDPVEMRINEILPGGGAPMTEQHLLDMLYFQRLPHQGITAQVDLPYRQIIGSSPVGIDLL